MILNYKNHTIEVKEDSHCATIYKNDEIVKMITGDIKKDGSNNAVEKSKKYIDEI